MNNINKENFIEEFIINKEKYKEKIKFLSD